MSSLTSATDQRSPTEQTPSREPIAIIGIGCRFPQAEGPEAFWRLLRDGVDAITEVPPDRFDINAYYDPRPGTPGKLISRYGGFIEGIEQFDPYFFGISPREAAGMDPQQRLALETAWAAIEDAGLPRARLAGSATGVFIGVCGLDYHTQLDAALGEAAQDIYAVNGNLRAVVPGRVSFWLGLQGPSIAVDAACASSLVAIQLACQSLWSGECTLALAGGVNVVLMPGIGLGFSRAGMLAPDGRCKFGDAAADGFVRSDGAAMLALKPLARARAEGDPIYALIRGGAVNNDGQGSGALMTPSRSGQEAVLRAAYRQAGVDPGRVAFVESHGTGTVAGDPVELDALGAVLGERRAPGAPCLVGSVKTNIGHTEATAGVAGVIKAALALKHGLIPPTLHVRSLNPAVDWDALPVRMARQATPWPAGELPRFAGISSFGISGTNAHLVLQEAPPASPAAPSEVYPAQRPEASGVPLPQLLALSAHTPEALRALAAAHAEALAAAQPGGTPYEDWCRTAAVRRTHHRHRLALVAGDADDAARRLRATAGANAAAPGMYLGQETATRAGGDQPHGLVWVFPGHGVQWLGMGKALLEHEPAFREALDRCDQAMRDDLGWSIPAKVAHPTQRDLDRIEVVGPLIFALQVALAALWRAWGIKPDAIVGHSMGEIAAAHVAGALSLRDAGRAISRRCAILARTAGQGSMLLVGLPPDELHPYLEGSLDRLAVGAFNSPTTTVVSGDHQALAELARRLEHRQLFHRPSRSASPPTAH